jgi:ligand-binding sensor domain-containing protein/signal transduction histidine kinase
MKINLLFTILCFSTYLNAQHIQYGWRNYTTNDGLPSPEVYTVIQDSKGYLWFGTDNGVSRFDGYTFQNFGAKEGLADNVINAIQEDATGRIWLGSMWGKLYYFEKDTIRPFKYNAIIESYQQFFTLTNGFSRFEKSPSDISLRGTKQPNPTSDIQNPKSTEGGILLGLSLLGILKITDDGKSELITAQEAPSLLVFPSGKKNVVVYQVRLSGAVVPTKPLSNILYPLFFYDGQKLVKQQTIQLSAVNENISNARLHILGKTTLLFTMSYIHRMNETIANTVRPCKKSIYDVLTDEDGEIWAAEGGNGGVKTYKNAEAIGENAAKILLKDVSAVSLLRDRDGGYWVTTLERGVFYLRDKRVQVFNQENVSFPFEGVDMVADFDKSKVFVGFKQGEVGLFDKSTRAYQMIDRLPDNALFDMKWDALHQKLWFGSSTQSRTWQQGQVSVLKSENGGLVGLKKMALRPQKDAAWLLGHNGVLKQTVGSVVQTGLKTMYLTAQSRVLSVFEDRQNRLWAGKLNGVYRAEGDSFVAVKTIHSALQTRVEDIAELPDGSLVFATKGNGIVVWNGKDAQNISTKDGLLTDMIENVATDAKGNIWVGTLAGLHKLSPLAPKGGDGRNGQWHIQPITLFHGLPTNEINNIAPNTEGVFLATPKGLVFYHDTVSTVSMALPFFEKMSAGKKQYTALSGNMTFAYDENDVELGWNTINFRMSGKIPYRYRLDSLAEWRPTFNRNVVLAALSAGHYRFEVQAQNEEGGWSSSLIVPFVVNPVWYATAWFRWILIGLAVLGGYIFYYTRIKRLKAEYMMQLHINDLERTALAMQMNPHFIFNCLNSIQLLIQRNEKDAAMMYLSRFAKLVRFTLESTRRGKVTIDEEAQALDNYLTLEKLRFKDGLEFSVDVDEAIDGFDTEIPAMLIQPFVENAVKHGFTMDDKAAKITVNVVGNFSSETHAGTKVSDYIRIEIRDNGKGIDRVAMQQKVSQPLELSNTEGSPFQEKTGVGIALSRQRLVLHNGENTPDDLKIETIMGANEQVLGTCVVIRIKISEN